MAVTVQTMDGGDCASMPNTLEEAERQLHGLDARAREVVADKEVITATPRWWR